MISSRFGDWYNTILHMIHAIVADNSRIFQRDEKAIGRRMDADR